MLGSLWIDSQSLGGVQPPPLIGAPSLRNGGLPGSVLQLFEARKAPVSSKGGTAMPKVSNETSVVPSDAQVTNDGGNGKIIIVNIRRQFEKQLLTFVANTSSKYDC
jgi:hypothetical protein